MGGRVGLPSLTNRDDDIEPMAEGPPRIPTIPVDLEDNAIVLDIGTSTIRAGLAGEDEPLHVYPTVVAHNPSEDSPDCSDCGRGEQLLVSHDALKQSNYHFPMNHGLVENWDEMEKLCDHALRDLLNVDPSRHGVLMTERALGPKANREKWTEVFFERFHVGGFYIALSLVLDLYATGRTTGAVLDAGEGVTSSVVIYEGYLLPHSMLRDDFGGLEVTLELARPHPTLLAQQGLWGVQTVKKDCCFVAPDFNRQLSEEEAPMEWKFPDGNHLNLGSERYAAPEALFNLGIRPSERHRWTLQDMLFATVEKTDLDIRMDAYRNIVFAGGCSCIQGASQRLDSELLRLRHGKTLRVNCPKDPQQAWIGGSILASLTVFESMWIAQSEYDEAGSSVLHRKCF